MERAISVSMPGCIGDALYSWTVARHLAAKHGCKVDFVTSDYCATLERFCRYQSWCRDFIIPPGYKLSGLDMGGQPWEMPIDRSKYEAVYHCGFRSGPDIPLPQFMARQAGIQANLEVEYDCPDDFSHMGSYAEGFNGLPCGGYVVIAPRGYTSFWEMMIAFAVKSKLPVVEVGGPNQHVGSKATINCCGLDFLETASLISRARAYVGIFSSNLVVADGFNIPRICCHDGIHWNLRVGVHTAYNLYPANPTPEDLLRHTAFLEPASRCYHPDDMVHLLGEANNVDEMTGYLRGTYYEYHPGRRWEYGLAMQILKRAGIGTQSTVLDVGGASSVLPALVATTPRTKDRAIRIGANVTIVDPCAPDQNMAPWVAEQEKRIGQSLHLVQKDFLQWDSDQQYDFVQCVSVIEHVPNDTAFFAKLMHHVKPGGVLYLTCDFYPESAPRAGHIRCYTRERLMQLLEMAKGAGFENFGGEPDWTYHGAFVYDYTFASLVLRRKTC